MFCINCGADNLDAAKFCRKCGAATGVREAAFDERNARSVVPLNELEEEETRVVRRGEHAVVRMNGNDEAEEDQLFSITPTLLFVKIGYGLAAVAALFLVALFSAFSISPLIAIFIGLLFFLVPGFYHLRQKLIRYSLTESKLEIDKGLISRSTRSVPLRRIQDVTVTSCLLQRLLGFGDLVIDNASEEGGKAVLKNINTPKQYADILLKQMRKS